MYTWTIIATLITGAVLGMFILAGGIALGIRHEDKKRTALKAQYPGSVYDDSASFRS